jgi:hypothetical protein
LRSQDIRLGCRLIAVVWQASKYLPGSSHQMSDQTPCCWAAFMCISSGTALAFTQTDQPLHMRMQCRVLCVFESMRVLSHLRYGRVLLLQSRGDIDGALRSSLQAYGARQIHAMHTLVCVRESDAHSDTADYSGILCLMRSTICYACPIQSASCRCPFALQSKYDPYR